jgi:Tfp pilus assembly protein PilV
VSRSRNAKPRRRGFTLIEAAMSIAVTSILLVAMGGALLMSVRAVDTGDDSAAAQLSTSEKLSQLNAELSVATSISTMAGGDLLFSVPDRNGDGNPEAIEYTWSGVDGDPIKRSYNGSTAASFIPSIRSIAAAVIDRPPAVPVVSSEQTLISCDSPSGASYNTFAVDTSNWAAQYVRPTLPSGAVSWSITKVRFVLTRSGPPTATINIGIRTADATGRPTSTVLAFTSIAESALPASAAWTEVALGPVTGLASTQGVCLTVRYGSGSGTVCSVTYAQGSSAQPFNSHMITSSDGGSTWSAPTDAKDLRFVVLGTYTTMVEP